MDKMNTSMWQYAPNNSPLPLPKVPFVCSNFDLQPLQFSLDMTEEITLKQLQDSVDSAMLDKTTLGEFLQSNFAPSMNERMPILLLGELANPFQLSRLKLGIIPVVNVRLQGLCRTYADGLDARMIRPGVHHITLSLIHISEPTRPY